jgi:hypothetical protein
VPPVNPFVGGINGWRNALHENAIRPSSAARCTNGPSAITLAEFVTAAADMPIFFALAMLISVAMFIPITPQPLSLSIVVLRAESLVIVVVGAGFMVPS